MFGRLFDKLFRPLLFVCGLCAVFSIAPAAMASPFGQGVFGADVPFGSLTSLTIALGGDVSLDLVPNGSVFEGSGSHVLTVTSTDVVGYNVYIYSTGSTSLVNGSYSIPASSNTSLAPLATNSWGYNIDGSDDYIGITGAPVLLKSATGPYKNGDDTTVQYGVVADITKGEGDYTASVTYTAVALNY